MGYICKLTRGALTFNLNSTPYSLAAGFIPPAILETADIATGGSANKYGGGKKVGGKVLPSEYSFTIRVLGNSNAQCEQAIDRLDTFLRSGSDSDPVYFCFKPDNNVSHKPLWGQFGATRRCKVLAGHCEKNGEIYGEARDRAIFADVSLTLNPVEGLRQMVGLAAGGIAENRFFSPDGISRGLMIPEGTTNLCTDPVFGAAVLGDWWATGAGLISAVNTDKNFVYPGATNSVKLTRLAGAPIVFNQQLTLTVATYTLSAYVKKADGTVTSDADVQIYYIDAKASTHTYMGNGITRVSWTGTGNAALQATGVSLPTVGMTIYLLGYQVELKGYATPLCWGDLMGCAWGGTAHQSSTIRTGGRWCISPSKSLNVAEGTIVMAWMPDKANTALTADVWLFEEPSEFQSRFDNDDEKFYFSDGTNTISSAATTFAANTPMVLHYVWEAGSLKIYRAGAEIATGNTYTPHAWGSYLYLGTDESAANNCNGTFLGFHTYEYAMSATEVANDYTNINAHITGGDGYGQRLETIPWEWDTAGNGVIGNCDDSTHTNWFAMGGIGGSLPAKTEIEITPSTVSKGFWLLYTHLDRFIDPTSQWYYDVGAVDDADASGGHHLAIADSDYVLGSVADDVNIIGDHKVFIRIKSSSAEAGNNQKPGYTFTSTNYIMGDPVTVDLTTNYKWAYLGSIGINAPDIDKSYIAIQPLVYITCGGAASALLDYFMCVEKALRIYSTPTAGWDKLVINGYDVMALATNVAYAIGNTTGDIIEVLPDNYNFLYFVIGDGSDTHAITDTATLNAIYITPRWALA